MASNDGFLTDEQRELLRSASQNRDSSHSPRFPKSPRSGPELQGKHVAGSAKNQTSVDVDGFLTDEQRELLRSASLGRDSVHSLKLPKSPSSGPEFQGKHVAIGSKNHAGGAVGKHDKRSHSGKNGRPKKSGCGGKGTWGGLLDTDGDVHLDRNDPNYDSEEKRNIPRLVKMTMVADFSQFSIFS